MGVRLLHYVYSPCTVVSVVRYTDVNYGIRDAAEKKIEILSGVVVSAAARRRGHELMRPGQLCSILTTYIGATDSEVGVREVDISGACTTREESVS